MPVINSLPSGIGISKSISLLALGQRSWWFVMLCYCRFERIHRSVTLICTCGLVFWSIGKNLD